MNFKVTLLEVILLQVCVSGVICCKNQTFTAASAKAFTEERTFRFSLNGCINKTEKTVKIQQMTISGYTPVLYEGSVQNLNKLQKLDMSLNSINKIEPGAYKNLSSLKMLRLDRNEIREIREEYFHNLPLTELFIAYNNISHIEPGTFVNTTLKTLLLSHNRLDVFTPEWFIESNLEELSVAFNEILYIPENAFQDLQRLTKVCFSNNDIANIHRNTFGSTLLQELELDHNALSLFSPHWFIDSNVEMLDLSYNYINYIPERAFTNVRRLTSVNFAYNEILSLHPNAFKDARNLMTLDLSNNKIKMLPDELFDAENAYHLISLHTNYLSFLSQQFLNNLNTTYITFHTNPWQCACYFPIVDWFKTAKISAFARNRGCTRYKNPVCVTMLGYENTCKEDIMEEIYFEYYKTFNFKYCRNVLHFKQLLEDGYVSCTKDRNEFCGAYEKYFPNETNLRTF